jgi:hypothetical protein
VSGGVPLAFISVLASDALGRLGFASVGVVKLGGV